MSFKYSQSSGALFHNGVQIATGYSGHGSGLDNPQAQDQHAVGPLPQGQYTIQPPHADEQVGPVAMRLDPSPDNEMFGRGDFLMHGDNPAMNHTASDGCIILPHDVRVQVGAAVLAGDNQLEVMA